MPNMATVESAPKKLQWVEPAPWDIVPGIQPTRCKAFYDSRRIYKKNTAHLVPDRGYDVYLDEYMTKTTEWLELQLEHPDGVRANVQNAVVCSNLVNALKDALTKKRDQDELAKHSADLVRFSLDGPPAKRPRAVEPAPPPEPTVTRHVPYGPRGQTIRVEVPVSLDAGD